MKFSIYAMYVARSLARGGQRTLLAIFCVAVGVLAIVALQLVGNAVDAGLTGNIRSINGGDVAVSSPMRVLTDTQLSIFDQMQTQGVITTYTAVYSTSGQATGIGGNALIEIRAVDPTHYPLAGAPRFLTPYDGSLSRLLSGTNVVISNSLARAVKVHVGSKLNIVADNGRATTVTIVGIIDRGEQIFPTPLLLMAFNSYQTLPHTGKPSITSNLIYADVPGHSDTNANTVKTRLLGELPLASITTARDALRNNQSVVANLRLFLQTAGLLALLIGGLGISNTMEVLLRRRTIEIAMLKTVGYKRLSLYTLFGLEAGVIGLVGGIIGAAAGVGISFGVQALVENAFGIALPVDMNPLTVASGLLIGTVTALIFGVLPIARASRVRPLTVLREIDENAPGIRESVTILRVIVAALFFGLALSITRNNVATLIITIVTVIILGMLRLSFGILVNLVSQIPINQQRLRGYIVTLSIIALVGIGLSLSVPALGAVTLVFAVLGFAVLFLPRRAKSITLMALRNLGRQQERTVTTSIALFIGIFTMGVLLVLGQSVNATIALLLAHGPTNAAIVASAADHTAVEAVLATTTGITRREVNLTTQNTLVAVNNMPFDQFVQAVNATGPNDNQTLLHRLGHFSGIQGYDLSHGQLPDATEIGFHVEDGSGNERGPAHNSTTIAPQGRLLNAGDANSSERDWQDGAGGLLLVAAVHETGLLAHLETALALCLIRKRSRRAAKACSLY